MIIFVYGTLKRNCCRNFILTQHKSTFIRCTTTKPLYKLYNLGSFPGLVEKSTGVSIQGELWEISDRTLEYLDTIEGVSHGLYYRKNINLEDDDDDVEAYFFNGDVSSCEDVGDNWIE